MAIDPTIALQLRNPQIDGPMQQYGNALQIVNAQQRNRLLDMEARKTQRDFEADDALGQAYTGAINPDGTINRNALLATLAGGKAASKIPGVQKQFLEVDDKRSQIDEREAKLAAQHLGLISSAFAPLVGNPNITEDDVGRAFAQARMGGVPEARLAPFAAQLPQNMMRLPDFVKGVALFTKDGLDKVQAMLPKVDMRQTMGPDRRPVEQPYNTNAMAPGGIGPIANAPTVAVPYKLEQRDTGGSVQTIDPYLGTTTGQSVPKTMTPGESARLAEDRRHHGVTEGQGRTQVVTDEAGNITIVNRDTFQARPAVGPDGQPLRGKAKDTTEGERMSAGYAERMERAEKVLTEKAGAGKPSFLENSLSRAPLTGEGAANLIRSPDRQQYRQAQEDWVRAKLRRESGAVIGEDEMKAEIRTYFPQLGDGPAVIEQKARARATASQAMRGSAGKATIPGPRMDAGQPLDPVESALQKYAPRQ